MNEPNFLLRKENKKAVVYSKKPYGDWTKEEKEAVKLNMEIMDNDPNHL